MENNIELIKKWIETLKSGQYSKTTGRLRSGNSFCAFGVLCDLSDIGKWSNDVFNIIHNNTTYPYVHYTPIKLENLCGVDLELRDLILDLNDNKHLTFPEIAKEIEAWYKKKGVL